MVLLGRLIGQADIYLQLWFLRPTRREDVASRAFLFQRAGQECGLTFGIHILFVILRIESSRAL